MQNRTQGAASSRKVLQLLDVFTTARPSASIDELASAVGVPRSTAYRYVALLKETGLVAEDGRGGYYLSSKFVRMAAAARAAVGYVDLAKPVLGRLRDRTDETVLLVQRIADNAVCVARAESHNPVRLSYDVGASFLLHEGAAPGKVLLANMREAERETYLSRNACHLPRTRIAALKAELEIVRKDGIATAIGEIIPDVWGIAVPVSEGPQVIAALCVAGPAYRLSNRAMNDIEASLREAAAEITRNLG